MIMFNDDAKKRSPSLPSFHIFSIFRISYEYFMIRSSDVSACAPLRSLFLPRRPFPPFSYLPLFPPVPSLLTVIIYFFPVTCTIRAHYREKNIHHVRERIIFFFFHSSLSFFPFSFPHTHTNKNLYNITIRVHALIVFCFLMCLSFFPLAFLGLLPLSVFR